MKVAFYGAKGLPSKGGAERVAEAVARRLSGRHEIIFYCDARYTPPATSVPGVRLVRIPSLRGKHLQATSFFALSALHAVLVGGYDVVHLHSVEASFMLPVLRLRYPVLSTAHGSPTRSTRSKWGPLARRLMALTEYPFLYLSSETTSVSEVDADYYAMRFHRRPVYVPNGVDEDLGGDDVKAAEVLERSGLRRGDYVLFAAGRIDPTKGCHLVVEAFAGLEHRPGLVVAGDLGHAPEYADTLRADAGDDVTFTGLIADRATLFGLVAGSRLFVFPSLTEGMSMMLLEAAALGAPLVCSDITENRHVLGERALYFRSGNADDLRDKLAWALAHPDEMVALAAKAREHVRLEYSWDAIAARYEELYLRIAGRHD